MRRERHRALEQRRLKSAAVLGRSGAGPVQLEPLQLVVPVKTPRPDSEIARKVFAHEQSINSVGDLKRVARVDAVEPSQRPEQQRRPEVDLLEAQSAFEPGRLEPRPRAVCLQPSCSVEVVPAAGLSEPVRINGDLAVDDPALRQLSLERQRGDVANADASRR